TLCLMCGPTGAIETRASVSTGNPQPRPRTDAPLDTRTTRSDHSAATRGYVRACPNCRNAPTWEGGMSIVDRAQRQQERQRAESPPEKECINLVIRPMLAKPNYGDWSDFISHIGGLCIEADFDLIIFDTISAVAPWKNENDSADVQGTLTPLNGLLGLNAAILL